MVFEVNLLTRSFVIKANYGCHNFGSVRGAD
jgi:hypothetical protein